MIVKVHKIEILVLDFENSSEEDVIREITNNKYYPAQLLDIKTKEIDNWADDHPLNKRDSMKQAMDDLFYKSDIRMNRPAYNID